MKEQGFDWLDLRTLVSSETQKPSARNQAPLFTLRPWHQLVVTCSSALANHQTTSPLRTQLKLFALRCAPQVCMRAQQFGPPANTPMSCSALASFLGEYVDTLFVHHLKRPTTAARHAGERIFSNDDGYPGFFH